MADSPIIRADHVGYAYPQHGYGLPPLDFRAEAGQMWAVTGRSGCGKSTLARCLTGLIPHLYHGLLDGQVLVDGHDTRTTPLWRLCETVGMLFQNPANQIVGSTVESEVMFGLEHLDLPHDERRARCQRAMERFGLSEMASRRPLTLSGGEQQRLMLASVLAREPKALVLDEPLSMLDTSMATELVGELGRECHRGVAVVACEHRADYMLSQRGAAELALPSQRAWTDPPSPGAPPWATDVQRVEVSDLTLAFGKRELFRDLAFDVRGGEVVALIGRNGVGKSTILRALAGLQPHEGTIRATPEPAARDGRPGFMLMFQNPDWQLFNGSVRSEIRYRLPSPDDALYDWLLGALSLTSYEEIPPLVLSEGEKKRVALATLLMRRPRLGVLLDEPTLGQDDGHRAVMGRVARSLAAAGCIVVAATHDLPWARDYCDRTLLLGQQRILADGPTRQVLRDTRAWQQAELVVPPWVLENAS